jgi:hypothetical protein
MKPTRTLPGWAYYWPGLPQLWLRGSWAGLLLAVVFTTLVNTLLLAGCVYREWFPMEYQLGGAGVAGITWVAAWWWCRKERRYATVTEGREADAEYGLEGSSVAPAAGPGEQWYREAQQAYLRADWVSAEQLLLQTLKHNARDVEARLLLATLWRRQGRLQEAARQLDKLARLEAAEDWKYEIEVERQEIAAASQHPADIKLAEVEQDQPDQTHNSPETHAKIEPAADRRMAA